MIKVDKVEEWPQGYDGKRMYFVTYTHAENNSFYGGFTEYIATENLPKKNQLFYTPRALEKYCRGKK